MSRLRVEDAADAIIAADTAMATATSRAGKPATSTIPVLPVYETAIGGPVETGGGLPFWVIGGLIGIVVLLLVGGGIAFGLIGGGQPGPTPTQIAGGSPTPSATPTASSSPSPSVAPTPSPSPTATPLLLVFPQNEIFDGCLWVLPIGNITMLTPVFTVADPQPGDYVATYAQGPTGPLSGTSEPRQDPLGSIVIPVRATSFGTYGTLSITAPDGSPVALGPLADLFPFVLNAESDKPTACDPKALASPTPQALAGRFYLAAVAPVNTAQSAFFAKAEAWSNATTNAVAQADAAALLAAFEAVDPKLLLLAAAYPPAGENLRAVDQAVLRLVADLSSLADLETIGVSAWLERYEGDLAALSAASRLVRQDLGLPALQ